MTPRLNIICIWICFILLLVLGVIMVASTGTCVPGQEKLDWHQTFLGKQCMYGMAGLVLALVLSHVDYHIYRRFVYVIWGICTLLLICCYLPGIGKNINGESRWIGFGSLTFQPSELAKIVLMITLAHWYTTRRESAGTFWMGFVMPAALLFGFPLMLLATLAPKQPVVTWIILLAFFLVMNVILFRSFIFKKRK